MNTPEPEAQPTLQEVFDESFGARDPLKNDKPYQLWKAQPTPQTLRQVVDAMNPTIDQAVHQYVGAKASPTVRQRARLLAAKAIQSWDGAKGANIRTHLNRQLQALQRMAPAIQDPFSPSERFRQHQQEIQHAAQALGDQLQREPTDEEIADLTGLPAKRVVRVRTRMRSRLPQSVYEEGFDPEDDNVPDIVGSERTDFDDWVDAVYADSGELDRLILMHRTGYRGADKLDNTEIARRLNISPAAVSQRAKRIQQRLDELDG